MTTAKPASQPTKPAAEPAWPTPARTRPPRYWPGWTVRIVLAVCLLLIVVVRTLPQIEGAPFPWNDMAVGNVATGLLSFIAAVTLLSWFCFRSSYPPLVRWITLAGAILLAVVPFVPFRYEGVDGRMVPHFAPRWRPVADRALAKVEVPSEAPTADLATTTADDFPQFLGPDRNCYLSGAELARDWPANPPKEVWRRPIGAGWSGFAAVNGFAVTLEQRGPEELVTCYEVGTGKPVWVHAIEARHDNPLGGVGPRSTPTIHSGRVYALGATGVLRCLEGKDGTVIWQDDLRKRYGLSAIADEEMVQWGRANSPLIVDDLVIVPGGGPLGNAKSLIAFKAQTGDVAWEGGSDQIGYASPALATIAGVRQVLSVNEKTATGHDPETGEVLWSHDWPGHSNGDANNSQPVALGNLVLLSKGYGGGAELLSFTADGGELVKKSEWISKQVLETKFTNVTVIDGYIYGLSNGYLECVELSTGRKTWKRNRLSNYGHGQVLGVGQVILVLGEEGRLALVEANPRQFIELGSIQALDGKTWNNLCLTGHKLLIRNGQEMACYELP